MPRVSVVMSVYEGVPSLILEKAIASILGQTFRDFEFIITADGRLTTPQQTILEQAMQADGRIKLVWNDQRMGPGYAANCGIAVSCGELVARMDADDMSLPERLGRQVSFLDEHQDVELVGTFAYEIDKEDRIVFAKRLPTMTNELRSFLARRDPFIHPTLMFRKRFFDRLGTYKTHFRVNIEDTELECRAFSAGVAGANIPEFLYMFRVDEQFMARRRGRIYAAEEAGLRWRYVRDTHMPTHYYLYPIVIFLMRLSPEWLLRYLYQFAR